MALAGIEMAHRFRGMGEDGHSSTHGYLHQRGHDGTIPKVEALSVGVQLPDADQPGLGAPFDLGYSGITPPRIHGAETLEA